LFVNKQNFIKIYNLHYYTNFGYTLSVFHAHVSQGTFVTSRVNIGYHGILCKFTETAFFEVIALSIDWPRLVDHFFTEIIEFIINTAFFLVASAEVKFVTNFVNL